MKKNLNKLVLSLFLLLFNLSLVFSQTLPSPPPEKELAGEIGGKSDVPIDNFIILLVCIAVLLIAYSSKKFYKKTI